MSAISNTVRYRQIAPRYRLGTGDRKTLRFVRAGRSRRVMITRLHDLSSSGLSFLVPEYMAPKIGGVLGLEFSIPKASQIACMGRVARVEPLPLKEGESKVNRAVKVGVAFANLPAAYQKLIMEKLNQIFHDAQFRQDWARQERRSRNWGDLLTWETFKTAGKVLAVMTAGAALVYGLYVLEKRQNSISPSWADNFAKQATGK